MNHCNSSCIQRNPFSQCPHEIEGILRKVYDSREIEKELPAHRNFDLMEEIDRQLAELEQY